MNRLSVVAFSKMFCLNGEDASLGLESLLFDSCATNIYTCGANWIKANKLAEMNAR